MELEEEEEEVLCRRFGLTEEGLLPLRLFVV